MFVRDPWVRALVIVMCAIATIYLAGLVWQAAQQFSDIVLLFFLAWLLAFVLEPVVAALSRYVHLPRMLAIGLTYSTLMVLMALSVILLVPALTTQVVDVLGNLPGYAEQVARWVSEFEASTNEWLELRGSPLLMDIGSALDPQELSRRAEAIGVPLLANAVQLATSAVTVVAALILVIVLSFYFMVDGGNAGRQIVMLLPERVKHDARFLVVSVHRAFAGFLRGQLIQALLSAIATGILMSLLRVDYALLASVVAGVILLIPLIGTVLGLFVPVLIALFTRPDAAIPLFVLLLIQQQIVFNLLAPRIMSQQVGLHPLLVFFAVLAGTRVGGIWGAIFGVPVVAVVVTMVTFYRLDQATRSAQLQDRLGIVDAETVRSTQATDLTTEPGATDVTAPVAVVVGRDPLANQDSTLASR